MQQLTLTITILSLILMSNNLAEACTSDSSCAGQCPPGTIANCIGGKCFCSGLSTNAEEAAAAAPLPVQGCIRNCDCHLPCHFGHNVCIKNICGCIDHPRYVPIC